jgi:hypothetical protein
MACEVLSMNSFRSAILSGKGLHPSDPLVREKREHSTQADDLGSVEIPRNETRTHNHRDDDRHRLDSETASARHCGEVHAVEIINLSGGGAMIRADFKPRLWDRVDLILAEGAEIECAVRWLRGDRCGLEFAHETKLDCDPEARDALLLDVIRRSFADASISSARPNAAPLPEAREQDDEIINSRRAERRHPLIWMGEVLYNHSSDKVRLRNISENGALIESQVNYPLDAELYLDLGDAGQQFATVSWACADKFGLKFASRFDIGLLGKSLPEVAAGHWTRPGPSRLSADQDNPWASGWQRQSLEELRDDLEGYLKR